MPCVEKLSEWDIEAAGAGRAVAAAAGASRRGGTADDFAVAAVGANDDGHVVRHFGEMREGVLPEVLCVELVPGLEVSDVAATGQWVIRLRGQAAVLLHQSGDPFLPDAVAVGTDLTGYGRHAGLVLVGDVIRCADG